MNSHPLDSLALVFGVGGVISGVIALLHQSGVISLGLPAVAAIAVLVIGAGGVALAMLDLRRR